MPTQRCLFLLLTLTGSVSLATAQKTVDFAGKAFHYRIVIDSTLSADSVNWDCQVKSITILTAAGETVQKIRPPENGCSCGLPADQIFIIEDVNFDRKEDIRLLQFEPADPNLPYYFWTYVPTMRRFVRQRSLEEITSPMFDHTHQVITSFWRSGCCDHGLNIYRYVNGKPLLFEAAEEAQDTDDETKTIVTLRKRIGGKMTLVKRTVKIDKGGR
jgi:hypothetical protein